MENKKSNNRHFAIWIVALVILLCCDKIHAQQYYIQGPNTVNYGETVSYTLGTMVGDYEEIWWGGDVNILNNNTGYESTINVLWDFYIEKAVWFNVSYYNINTDQYYYDETTIAVLPPTPIAPTVLSASCNEVVLQRNNAPVFTSSNPYMSVNEVVWYWQSSSDGTSTANSASTITLTSGNQYFLRAKSIADYGEDYGTWSAASSSVSYTIGNPAPLVGTITQPTSSTPTGSVVLSGLPGTGTWTINPGNISGTGTSKTVTGLSASATYNFTVTTAGCTSGSSANVVINAVSSGVATPTLSSVTQPTSTTSTGSFTITNYNASYTYTAIPSTGVIFSGGTVTAPSGNYIIVASSGGSSSSPSVNVTVNAQPIVCGVLSNENYIHTITPTAETTDVTTLSQNQKTESITYFDGLGRQMQNIGIRAGKKSDGTIVDIITHIEYDAFGRQTKDYLPYTDVSNCGMYRSNSLASIGSFYNTLDYESTLNPYSEKEFEASPLNRVLKQAAPGASWALGSGHEIKMDYQSNGANEVRSFGVSLSYTDNAYTPKLTLSTVNGGYYNADELYKKVTKDENWISGNDHTTEEFKDRQGKIVLKRTYDNNIAHDTYYVYDDYGNLTYVLPPLADTASIFITSQSIAGYDNFSKVFNQSVFSGTNNGSGSVTVTIENNTLKVVFSGGYISSILNNTPQDLLTTPCNLPDIDLGTISNGDYNVSIVNGKLKITSITGAPSTSFSAVFSVNLPNNCLAYRTEPDLDILNNLCFQYKYDAGLRLVEKKLPGKDVEYIIYDKFDRPILTQDPNLKAQNKWLFTKYDAFGRVAYTGLINSSSDRTALQNAANGTSSQYVIQSSTAITIAGTTIHYNNGAYPNVGINDELHTINYYDNYSFDLNQANATGAYDGTITNAKGLATGSKVRVLGTNSWITNVNYYDAKGRSICSYTKNDYLGTTTKVNSKLDFVGKVKETTTTHDKTGKATIPIVEKFTYDPQGRLLTQSQKINTQAEELIVSNEYDELGQLKEKGVGGKTTQSRLQTVNYTYNIRGWLKGINDGDSSNSAITMGSGDLFGFQINYNDPTDSSKKLFNGNISQTFWKTTNSIDTSLRNYTYTYDALNRLTDAKYSLADRYNETLSYDKNGNIMSLLRKGYTDVNATTLGTMDNLTYSYDAGNKLFQVEDSSNSNEGFKDGIHTAQEYGYDVNGNMTSDNNKGITAITYNHLNLPTSVTMGGGTINYTYDATGVKQRKVAAGTTTDYAGGFQYKDAVLQFFPTAEGYAEYNSGNGTFSYIYQYKDHLDNVRLSYKNVGTTTPSLQIVEESNYYPFGLKQKVAGEVINNSSYKYKFQGQERQDELGLNWDSFKWRNYDLAIGRFFNIDPLSEKYAYQSHYNFSENRVIDSRELEGLEAYGVFNKSTNTLMITPDVSKWKVNLPTKIVSATEYKADNTKYNQIIKVENVFTGGESNDGVVSRDLERPMQKPIPNGTYDILDNEADTKHDGWFRLDKQDGERFNDKDDSTGRSGFRFHLGTESWGCVTCDISKENRTEEWNSLSGALKSTTTTTVPERRGNQGFNPFSWLTNYGTLKVVGKDKTPIKKEEENQDENN